MSEKQKILEQIEKENEMEEPETKVYIIEGKNKEEALIGNILYDYLNKYCVNIGKAGYCKNCTEHRFRKYDMKIEKKSDYRMTETYIQLSKGRTSGECKYYYKKENIRIMRIK